MFFVFFLFFFYLFFFVYDFFFFSSRRRHTRCGRDWSSDVCSSDLGPGGRDESGKLVPLDVQVGNRVLFGKWSGTEVKLDGVEYLIMKESDIMGVLEETQSKKKAA